MSEFIVVVEQEGDWVPDDPSIPVLTAKQYLEDAPESSRGPLRVINLCRSYRYLSVGYYCSLLAEARGHRIVPTVRTIQDLSRRAIYSLDTADLDPLVDRVLGRAREAVPPNAFELVIMFGQCDAAAQLGPAAQPSPAERVDSVGSALEDVARQLFDTFRAPILKVEFRRDGAGAAKPGATAAAAGPARPKTGEGGNWRITGVRPVAVTALTAEQRQTFARALRAYAARPWRRRRSRSTTRYDLAILHNPNEEFSPSSRRSLQEFVKAARAVGMGAELIQRQDYGRLAEFDALFIRETTRIDHHTYQFAKKADGEGMVVIDDPDSILRCTNKVYLAELLHQHGVPTPRTVILRRDNLAEVERRLSWPAVLKIPDGSFSRGVFKAENRKALEDIAARLFKESDLLLAQEFVPTAFDWRVGVLNKQPLFVCQYFMSKSHWQIVDHSGARPREGATRTLSVEEAPQAVVRTALRAANLIGDGLYGVDLKETNRGVVVIEVNDNPNVDGAYEGAVLGDALYRRIMEEFVRRLDARRQRPNGVAGGRPEAAESADGTLARVPRAARG